MRRVEAGRLRLPTPVGSAAGNHSKPAVVKDHQPLAEEAAAVERFKQATVLLLSSAMTTYGRDISSEQEVLMHLSDMLIGVCLSESAVLRAQRAMAIGRHNAALHSAAARIIVDGRAVSLAGSAREACAAIAEVSPDARLPDPQSLLSDSNKVNPMKLRRQLADAAVASAVYPFPE
jgi:hypothetical protein